MASRQDRFGIVCIAAHLAGHVSGPPGALGGPPLPLLDHTAFRLPARRAFKEALVVFRCRGLDVGQTNLGPALGAQRMFYGRYEIWCSLRLRHSSRPQRESPALAQLGCR
jgi:hypothetical protein